jgi:CO dehydrogenase maturation factor
MVLRTLLDAGAKPVLAVDADPNSNFHTAIGVRVDTTVGSIRESTVQEENLPAGMSKPDYFEYRTRQALVEAKGFDFLSMGRPEGPGCYCFANSLLRAAIDRLAAQYAWVVVDCEAGLEHFSRRTAGSIDLLFCLSDASWRGLQTVRNILDLAQELGTPVKETLVAVNRAEEPLPDSLQAAIAQLQLRVVGCLPEDNEIRRRDVLGEPLLSVPENSALLRAVRDLLSSTAVVGPLLAPRVRAQ